jgi:hypothetical protein
MDVEKFERYEISHSPKGLHVFMWEILPRVGGGVIALAILAACFATDPYEGHGRIWAGLGVVALALVALFGVRVETWIISDNAVQFKSSIWHKAMSVERSQGAPLAVRVELVPCDAEGTRPPFPHVVHLVGPGGIEIGDGFHFRERSNLDLFLKAFQTGSPIDVEEDRTANEETDEPVEVDP